MHQPSSRGRLASLARLLAVFLLVVWPLRPGAEPASEGRFRVIAGAVRFANGHPEILGRLRASAQGSPNGLTVRASALPPHAGISAQVGLPAPDPVTTPYQLTVDHM